MNHNYFPYFLGIPKLGNQDNFVTLVQDAYKKTIMKSLNHPWVLQKTVLLALHTSRYWTRERLFFKVFQETENAENRKSLEENLDKVVNSMKKVYDTAEKLCVEKEAQIKLQIGISHGRGSVYTIGN